MRRLLSVLLGAALTLTVLAPAASADEGELVLKTRESAALYPGQTSWVNVLWQAKGGPVEDVVVTVRGNDVAHAYPSGRDHTSFTENRELGRNEIDFTAIQVTMPENARRDLKLKLRVDYRTDGERERENVTVTIPVRDTGGQPWVRQTDAVPVTSTAPTWVHVFFEGVETNDTWSVTATAPNGATVHYPEGRGDTSLHRNDELEPGEQDFVALLIDATDLEPGDYELPVTVSASTGSVNQTLRMRVS